MKIYLYGYLNRIQSSRRLERECQRNVELMWLFGRLTPVFKTIADFRKDNGAAIRAVCRQFVELCRQLKLFALAVVAIDGSKFKAINNRDQNYTSAKVKRRMEQIEESIARYLSALDTADRQEAAITPTKAGRLKEKINILKQQMQRLREIEAKLKDVPDGQISLTDRPDRRRCQAPPHCRPRSPEMAANAIAFIRALGLSKVDVLGFSIGGMVAQEIALQAPQLVRKLILVGTGPRGADMSTSKSGEIFAGTYDPPEHLWLAVHFSPSAASQAAGLAFLERKHKRLDRDNEVSDTAAGRQLEAVGAYIAGGESAQGNLAELRLPTLVVQGSNDVIIPTINSYTLQQKLPNAQLIIYPDANHGSFYQYPELFVAHATLFLDA